MSSRPSSSGSQKRALPSWASASNNESTPRKKNQNPDDNSGSKEQGDRSHQRKGSRKDITIQSPKLLDGVIFALSGFVNPERGRLRSQAMELGAEYRADWSDDCTLLVCAFPNTPKFRQVEADCGTIVSKEWISECYQQNRLVEIEPYLMHAGKPWRKAANSQVSSRDKIDSPRKLHQQVNKEEDKPASSPTILKDNTTLKSSFSPTLVKKWAADDMKETISWLENQDEKPEPDEMKKIASEGIITCLQDAIEALEQNQDIEQVMDQWMFVPHVVKELSVLENGSGPKALLSKEELIKLAASCKQLYTTEFTRIAASPVGKIPKETRMKESERGMSTEDTGFDSDATVEMTEEEIDLAYSGL